MREEEGRETDEEVKDRSAEHAVEEEGRGGNEGLVGNKGDDEGNKERRKKN